MDAPAPAGNHSEVPITPRSRSGQAARVWQQNRVFCALRTLHLRERLVETESALGVIRALRTLLRSVISPHCG